MKNGFSFKILSRALLWTAPISVIAFVLTLFLNQNNFFVYGYVVDKFGTFTFNNKTLLICYGAFLLYLIIDELVISPVLYGKVRKTRSFLYFLQNFEHISKDEVAHKIIEAKKEIKVALLIYLLLYLSGYIYWIACVLLPLTLPLAITYYAFVLMLEIMIKRYG